MHCYSAHPPGVCAAGRASSITVPAVMYRDLAIAEATSELSLGTATTLTKMVLEGILSSKRQLHPYM